MANGRPPGDGPDRFPGRPLKKGANEEGLSNLGRQMRSGADEGYVANEEGLKTLGARVDAANPRGRRRSGKARWSRQRKVVVSLLCVVALLAVAVGGTYGYLWYRFDQIDKVHIADEVSASSGQPFTILVIGSDSRVGDTGEAAQNFGSSSVVTGQRSDVVQLWRVTPASKTIQVLSIPRDTVVTMLPPDNSQFGTYNRINSSYNSRSTSPASRTRSTRWAASISTSRTRPRTPTPASTSRPRAASS
jgi:hypothetical protein